MKEKVEELPDDLRVNVVLPSQKNFDVVAVSDPIKGGYNVDKAYEQRVDNIIDLLNRQSEVFERDKNSLAHEMNELMQAQQPVEYDGQRVFRMMHSMNGVRQQRTMEQFNQFMDSGNHFVFDIETFGDSQDRINPYGISEISVNEYDKHGKLVKEGYNGVLTQGKDVINDLQLTLDKMSEDKYFYNQLPDYKKRTMVDLMRYATHMDPLDRNAFSTEGGIKHHSIIEAVFDEKDRVEHGKVIRNMHEFLPYMQSGLDTMKTAGELPDEAMKKFIGIMEQNPEKYFISYNGDNFDMPVVKAFAEKQGLEVPKNLKHLDYLNVIRTTFMDSDDLKRKVDAEYQGSTYGKDKLAAYVEDLLQIEDDEFHNATVDTNNTAKVVAATREHIDSEIKAKSTTIKEGLNHFPTNMTWDDTPLTDGQRLFANGGVMAYRDGEESFRASIDDEGRWVKETNGFNKSVINSKSFYQFAGHQDMGDGKHAFRFYDVDRDDYAFIVRQGDNAFNELQDFVQSRFYNWDNVDTKTQREISHIAETDRARRRYDRFFSLDGAGAGLSFEQGEVVERGTKGFSGLKRAMENAQVMKDHLESNGEIYRERVKQNIADGMSRKEAKKAARLVSTSELMDKLDFNSMWDSNTNSYVENEGEKKAFFKMHKRLIDEMPAYNQAIQMIDDEFSQEILNASKETNVKKRRELLKEINQQRDAAIMNYHQAITNPNVVGAPTQERKLKQMESHRIKFMDPEANEYRTLNFETAGTAHTSIYNYARRGVADDNPNKQRVIKERMNNLLSLLDSQNIITLQQQTHYEEILANTDSPWSASKEIAIHMRQNNGGKYEDKITEPKMNGNPNIKNLEADQNQHFVTKAIQDVKNAQMTINTNLAQGKKIELGEELSRSLRILDEQRFSSLEPKNFEALEELLVGIRKADAHAHVAMVMDRESADGLMKVYAYDGKHSATVQSQLARGVVPTQAVQLDMPLINASGTHKVGGAVLNGHTIATYENGQINTISSSQQIARGYTENMGRIMSLHRQGKIEEANLVASRTLRNQVSSISGIQRNIVGANDTYQWANNQSDELKQSHIKVGNAMVQDFYHNGYDGIKLTANDFYDKDNVFVTDKAGNVTLRSGINLQDIQMETQHKMLMKMNKWSEEKLGVPVFTSAVKSEHVSKGIVSTQDIRQAVPFGTFYNHGRDNMVQYMNSFVVNDETTERLQDVKGVTRERLLETPQHFESGRGNTGFNVKTAFMTQDQLRERINGMFNTAEGKSLLGDVGLLHEDGSLNHLKLPRLYEQQGIVANDLGDALKVDTDKRYVKGKQFEPHHMLAELDEIKPGQILGKRFLDNGQTEMVRYEGTKTGRLISGLNDGEDLIVRSQSDPFKLMLDGEKLTDSPVDRRFITALTGDADVAAIINPDVAKHQDFGMLMSGDARLIAEHVRGIDNTKKQRKAIRTVEEGNVGLKWNADMGGFIDHSFDQEIKSDAFDAVMKQLGISNKTPTGGYRVGVLEARMSKVENYSKVVDHTGNRVIDQLEKVDEETGEVTFRNTYGGQDGVEWGHREMSVLKSQGLDKTAEHVMQIMKEQGLESGRLNESRAIAESLKNMTGIDVPALTFSANDFESLPEQFKNNFTYRGTIFDNESIISKGKALSEKHAGVGPINEHGFWFELPSVERADGRGDNKVTVRMDADGNMKELDKIFIPFTDRGGTGGEQHLRDIQRHIGKIYEKADQVNKAGTRKEAQAAHQELQKAVTGYVNQSFTELSSSNGMMFGDAFKATMGGMTEDVKTSSASGLFKLMDFETSKQYGEGQHSVISEDMAKKMGIYDDLKNGKKMFAANVRYPTFHDGAMQFTQLSMSADVKPGEIHTSSFSSMLQNADSDGDYSHLVVMNDEEIQNEWKKQHDRTEQRFEDRWQEHLKKEDTSRDSYKPAKPVDLKETSDADYVPKTIGNTDAEMASKIGKMTIGRASNLNLFIRQVADNAFADDKEMNYKLKEFGRGLEQKLIDAKHGAEPVGLKMIDHIYAGEWDKALELDNQYFATDNGQGMFQEKYHMKDVARELPMALQRTQNGLYTQGMKFGTSTGVNKNVGVQGLIDLLYGNASPAEYAGDNKALSMWHSFLNQEEGSNIDRFSGENTDEPLKPIERSTATPMRDKIRSGQSKLGAARNIVTDAIGGGVSDFGGKLKKTFESMKNMSGKQKGILGAGLAVAGIAGYNIFNTDKPEMHYKEEQPLEEDVKEPEASPAISTGLDDYSSNQNASVRISASGSGGPSNVSQAVTQGMRDTGMSAGPTRISVNHQDNTQQLNRQWYQDKVRENI